MRPLGLLEQLTHIVGRLVIKARAFQQLRVTQDCGQRIVQLVRHTGNQLADGRHLLALQQLLLRPPQVFVRPASLLVELHLFDRSRQLPADGDQQILIVTRIVPVFLAGNTHDADGLVLAPEHNPDPVGQPVGAHKLDYRRWQVRQKILGHHFRSRAHYQIAQTFRKNDFGHAHARLAARAPTRAPPEGAIRFRCQIDRACLRPKQRDHLAQRQVQNFIQIERLRRDDCHRVERVQLTIAPPHLVFRAFLLRDVENEALIALNLSSRIARCKTALRHCQ